MNRRSVLIGALGLSVGLTLGGQSMTQPVQHGHPDWFRTVSAADIEVFNDVVVQADVELLHGRFFVGNMPYIWVNMQVNAGGVRLQLKWFSVPTGGTAITENQVDTRVTITAHGPFAVLAPWVELVTTVDATPRTVTLKVWQTLSASQAFTPDAHIALITQANTNIPGATTTLFNPIRVRWGWGYWTGTLENATLWAIRLFAVDYLNATFIIGSNHFSNPEPGGIITLPPMPVRLSVENADAGAHFFYGSVLMHPGPL